MADAGINRATERLMLACRALSGAADDLYVAFRRDAMPVERAAYALEAEAERLCELAEQLARLAQHLSGRGPSAEAATGTADGGTGGKPATATNRAKAREDSPCKAQAARRRRSASLAAGEDSPPGE